MIITTQHNRGDMVSYVTRTDTAYVLELFDVNKRIGKSMEKNKKL